jgi:hypothetical protein
MKVAIHQPHYWPWLGYLRKIDEADIFVYLDNAAYEKNGFQNRNRILVDGKERWITVPVLTKGRFGQPIKDVEVSWDSFWNTKHYHTLLYNYSKEMKRTNGAMKAFFEWDGDMLVDWCIRSLDFLCRAYKINTRIMLESEMNASGTGTERLASICREVGAGTYLSGPTGRDYMEEKMFGNIKIEYMDWKSGSHLSALHFYLIEETRMLRKEN